MTSRLGRRVAIMIAALAFGSLPPGLPAAAAVIDLARASGVDRIETAIALSAVAFPAGSESAVVAASHDFADALSAASLAAAASGPVLLNPKSSLDSRVKDELERLGVTTVYLMGGTEAQASAVETALDAPGVTAIRVSGADRFATAAAAAKRAAALWGASDPEAGDHVLVALGRHANPNSAWPDALAAGPLSGHAHWAILLTEQGSVPAATNDAIAELGATRVTVVGGTAAIPDSTMAKLGPGGTTRDRIGGDDRHHTSTLLADAAIAQGGSATSVIVVRGDNFADGLGAGPAAYARGGVIVLVNRADLDLSKHSARWLRLRRGMTSWARVAGGTAAVSAETFGMVQTALAGLDDFSVTLTPVATGLSTPLGVSAPVGDDRLFIVERPGRIRVVKSGSLRSTPFLDIASKVNTSGERGFFAVAFHPDYSSNRRFFVHYSRKSDGATVIAEYTAPSATSDTASASTEKVLRTISQPASNHNGGTIAFGPDGYLYVFLGDGGGSGDQYGNGQNTATQLGSVLRLDVSKPGTATPAPDNRFVGSGGHDDIWSYGTRNPFRASFDRVAGTVLIGDVGQSAWEEIDAVAPAAGGYNFGWPITEGAHCFKPAVGCSMAGQTLPVFEYANDSSTCVVTGGFVYRGSSVPRLRGQYLWADFCKAEIQSFHLDLVDFTVVDEHDWSTDLAITGSVYSFGEDASGELYVMNGSTVFRIDQS